MLYQNTMLCSCVTTLCFWGGWGGKARHTKHVLVSVVVLVMHHFGIVSRSRSKDLLIGRLTILVLLCMCVIYCIIAFVQKLVLYFEIFGTRGF